MCLSDETVVPLITANLETQATGSNTFTKVAKFVVFARMLRWLKPVRCEDEMEGWRLSGEDWHGELR